MSTEQIDTDSAWSPVTRVAFRLFVLYFLLYVATSRMPSVLVRIPGWYSRSVAGVLDPLVRFAGDHVFHAPVSSALTGSSDKMYDWLKELYLMTAAIAGCALWSFLDRTRTRYDRISRWFRVFLRFALGSAVIAYGFNKAFPLQMPAPELTRLLEPYGNFSPMGVLWSAIGASFPYERFTGLVEVAGGGLLFFPRTQLAGALVCVFALVEVFTLNMTYDVPVKLFSLNLLLMSVFLAAPYAQRIGSLVLSTTARSHWAEFAQVVFGLYLLGMAAHDASRTFAREGPSAGKPPLYGIWSIDTMAIDGVERLPLVTDYERWRRVIVQDAMTIVFWRMDDTFLVLEAKVNTDAKTISLFRGTAAAGSLKFEQPSPDHLILDGVADKHTLHMETQLVDHRKFQLLSRTFHWVEEAPVGQFAK